MPDGTSAGQVFEVNGEYYEQGDRDLHDKHVWEQRMLLRHHPLVKAALRRWCGVVRLPLTFSLEDCAQIARIIRAEVSAVYQAAGSADARA